MAETIERAKDNDPVELRKLSFRKLSAIIEFMSAKGDEIVAQAQQAAATEGDAPKN